MYFEKEKFVVKTAPAYGRQISYRAWEDIVFVDNPVDGFHKMNVYAPSEFFNGQSVNGYALHTAPVFLPNAVGGYLPCKAQKADSAPLF